MRKLLFSIKKKDFKIDYFSGTGSGGQHRNKHQNCVRIQHIESNVMSTGQSSKSRKNNIKEALSGLIKKPKFKLWLNRKIYEIKSKKTLEEHVEEAIQSKNLKIATRKNNKWISNSHKIKLR